MVAGLVQALSSVELLWVITDCPPEARSASDFAGKADVARASPPRPERAKSGSFGPASASVLPRLKPLSSPCYLRLQAKYLCPRMAVAMSTLLCGAVWPLLPASCCRMYRLPSDQRSIKQMLRMVVPVGVPHCPSKQSCHNSSSCS